MTSSETDLLLARTRQFQETIKDLFGGFYPCNTQEDKDVRRIMLFHQCDVRNYVEAEALPDEESLGEMDPPTACIPFLLLRLKPEQDYEVDLFTKAEQYVKTFHVLCDTLKAVGEGVEYSNIPWPLRYEFMLATKAFAMAVVQFSYKKQNKLAEGRMEIMNAIPTIAFRQLVGPDKDKYGMDYMNLRAKYFAFFGQALVMQDPVGLDPPFPVATYIDALISGTGR